MLFRVRIEGRFCGVRQPVEGILIVMPLAISDLYSNMRINLLHGDVSIRVELASLNGDAIVIVGEVTGLVSRQRAHIDLTKRLSACLTEAQASVHSQVVCE